MTRTKDRPSNRTAKESAAHTTGKRLGFRRGVVGAMLAIGVATGSIAAANAEPREWDIGAYDDCMRKPIHEAAHCCIMSGGVLGEDPYATDGSACKAPPVEQASESSPGKPARPQISSIPNGPLTEVE